MFPSGKSDLHPLERRALDALVVAGTVVAIVFCAIAAVVAGALAMVWWAAGSVFEAVRPKRAQE